MLLLLITFLYDHGYNWDQFLNGNYEYESAMSATSTRVVPTSSPIQVYSMPVVRHIATPTEVKGLYLSAWGAGDANLSKGVIDIIEASDALNAVVIDVKDYTGLLSFHLISQASNSPAYEPLYNIPNQSQKIKDVQALIRQLHDKNIYVIARIAVFQDPFISNHNKDWAIKGVDGNAWRDSKGLTWINPKNNEYWQYIEALSRYSYDIGFDEVNLDYIRFPTDGNISEMDLGLASSSKYEVINEFYEYMGDALYNYVPVSADLFGLTTANNDDMGIGQKIESGLRNFQFVSPMIYPSHYGSTFLSINDPDSHPYETVKLTMQKAHDKVLQLATDTDMENESLYWSKMRPWIQDFTIHHAYGVAEIEAQIRALHELGINSYLIWNASNRYTSGVRY